RPCWVRFQSSIASSADIGCAIANAGPSASTLSAESVTTVASSRIESRSVSRPVISRSIQTRRPSPCAVSCNVIRSQSLPGRGMIPRRPFAPDHMPPNASLAHYAILTAMLAPAFFLTATAALLASANARLARIIDRARTLLKDLAESRDVEERALLERRIAVQRRRSLTILRASQLL